MSENPNYQQNPGEFIPAPQQAPAYNMQGGYPGYQPKPGSGLAIASLICGILGVLTGIFIFSGLSLGLAGIVLGIVALVKVKNGTASGKGMAIGGIVTGALGMIVAVVVLILGMIGIGMLSECAEHAVQDSNGNYVCTVNGHTQTLDPDEYRTLRR
ncbi:DUF4190 domain-containing protein [Rothia mucilaginosa]|uniref:DUF4190 domain-containing protein n=1 Tax=Rothia mucilaginosa TaxID=43675 RepID=UPI0025E4E23C|nr:DUF4190 domain-containing protein [Rothia mucilaginosa]